MTGRGTIVYLLWELGPKEPSKDLKLLDHAELGHNFWDESEEGN